MAQKQPKNYNIPKWTENPFKSGKCLKPKTIPPFWGYVGVKKWSPFLDSGARSPIFGHLKMGTFGIFRCPKMGP